MCGDGSGHGNALPHVGTGRLLLTAARSFYNNANGWGSMSPPSQPIPGESELMREHTHLPAMVGFVRQHVAQHFQANRPRRSPAVSANLLDAAPTSAERFSKHLRAASGAYGQSRTGLLRRAVRG